MFAVSARCWGAVKSTEPAILHCYSPGKWWWAMDVWLIKQLLLLQCNSKLDYTVLKEKWHSKPHLLDLPFNNSFGYSTTLQFSHTDTTFCQLVCVCKCKQKFISFPVDTGTVCGFNFYTLINKTYLNGSCYGFRKYNLIREQAKPPSKQNLVMLDYSGWQFNQGNVVQAWRDMKQRTA